MRMEQVNKIRGEMTGRVRVGTAISIGTLGLGLAAYQMIPSRQERLNRIAENAIKESEGSLIRPTDGPLTPSAITLTNCSNAQVRHSPTGELFIQDGAEKPRAWWNKNREELSVVCNSAQQSSGQVEIGVPLTPKLTYVGINNSKVKMDFCESRSLTTVTFNFQKREVHSLTAECIRVEDDILVTGEGDLTLRNALVRDLRVEGLQGGNVEVEQSAESVVPYRCIGLLDKFSFPPAPTEVSIHYPDGSVVNDQCSTVSPRYTSFSLIKAFIGRVKDIFTDHV